jgi:hypothetical protein
VRRDRCFRVRRTDRLHFVCSMPTAFCRADARTRTGDPFITSEVLYQLSYVGEALTVAAPQLGVGRFLRRVDCAFKDEQAERRGCRRGPDRQQPRLVRRWEGRSTGRPRAEALETWPARPRLPAPPRC